jgi:hypothetical protein
MSRRAETRIIAARNASCGISTCRPLHALLAFLLLLEQLALARDVAAVALGEHVLAQRLDRLARDDAAPIAAWIATSNICRGISSRIFSPARGRGRTPCRGAR